VEGGKSKEEYGKVRKEKKAEEKQGKKEESPNLYFWLRHWAQRQ